MSFQRDIHFFFVFYKKAFKKYALAIKVTHRMAEVTANAILAKYGNGKPSPVKVVFAPYEADAQLVALVKDNRVDVVMTEDSDIIVYSVSANIAVPIVYKFDKKNGECDVLNMNWLVNERNTATQKRSCNASLAVLVGGATDQFATALRLLSTREQREPGLGRRLFVKACILSGCDYVPNLKRVGPVTAFKLIKENASRPSEERFKHIIRNLCGHSILTEGSTQDDHTGEGALVLDPTLMSIDDCDKYEKRLLMAEAAFFYHHIKVGNETKALQEMFRSSNTDDSANHFLPCVDKFENNLAFLGTAEIGQLPLFGVSQATSRQIVLPLPTKRTKNPFNAPFHTNTSSRNSSIERSALTRHTTFKASKYRLPTTSSSLISSSKLTLPLPTKGSKNPFEMFSYFKNQSSRSSTARSIPTRRVTLEASECNLPNVSSDLLSPSACCYSDPNLTLKDSEVCVKPQSVIPIIIDSDDDESECLIIDSPEPLSTKKTCITNKCSQSRFFPTSIRNAIEGEYRGSEKLKKGAPNLLAGFVKQQHLYATARPTLSRNKRVVPVSNFRNLRNANKRSRISGQALTMKDFCSSLPSRHL